MPEVGFHPEARDDYREALAWYRGRSRRAAERFEAEVDRVLGLASANPSLFPVYDYEHRFAMLHRFYSLIYEAGPDRVLAIAVARSSRSVGYWKGRS